MRFLADMGVSTRVADWLRDDGHDVIHLHEQGLGRLPNGDIFARAQAESRVVLTFDLDFGEIVAMCGASPHGVIIFRLRNTRSPHVMARLRAVLQESSAALEGGVVVLIEETRHRVRRFPLEAAGD